MSNTGKAAGQVLNLMFFGVLLSAFAGGWFLYNYLDGDLEAKAEVIKYATNIGMLLMMMFSVVMMTFAMSKFKGY